MSSLSTKVLGTVAMEPKGEYSVEAYYEKLNTVLYNDSTYMAIKPSHNILPTDTEYWQLIGGGVTKEYVAEQTVDNLDSTSTTKPLSANQGKNLNNKISGSYSFEDFVLYAFFDEKSSNVINLYISKDNLHLQKLELPNKIYGRDPSIIFYNNKFYIAITNYDSQHDFSIYESEDLINWSKHDINLGLYDANFKKRWCPDFFIDSDNSLYVFISKQHAEPDSIHLEGKFKTYVTKCENIDTFEFETPKELVLTGTEEDNYIDATCIKIDETYHLILKSDSQYELNLQHFTSTDLLNFSLISKDFGQLGRYLEGQFIYKFKGEYVLGAEKYYERDGLLSNYRIKTTKDLNKFSNYKRMYVDDIDISHGSAFVITDKKAKELIFKRNNYNFNYNYNFVFSKNNYLITSNTINHDYAKGRYLKIMSIYPKQNFKSFSLIFKLTDGQRYSFDSMIQFYGKYNNLNVPELEQPYVIQLSGKDGYGIKYKEVNLHGKIITLINNTEKCYDVYFDLNDYTDDISIMLDFISKNLFSENIVIYADTFVDELPISVGSMRDQKRCLNAFSEYNTLYVDNRLNNKLTVKMTCRNQSFRLFGHGINMNANKTYDYTINVLNGQINAINNNSQLSNPLTFTLDEYDSVLTVYTISITGLDNYSGFVIELPNNYGNGILDYTLSTV